LIGQHMSKKRITYRNGEIGKVRVVKDFLPPPAKHTTTDISEPQSEIALKVLPLIFNAVLNEETLSYADVAEELGRPRNNGRMIAQVCDLLDAAAALARTPLLALITVTEASGAINHNAWAKGDGSSYREAIIARSKGHNFSKNDFRRIQAALVELQGRSNLAAWKYVDALFGRESLLQQLSGAANDSSLPQASTYLFDALNDWGPDNPEVAIRSVRTFSRDPTIRAAVRARASGRCELCGELGFRQDDGTNYVETHHIIALADNGRDMLSNIIALCPRHHREAHYGLERKNLEREMIKKVTLLQGRKISSAEQ